MSNDAWEDLRIAIPMLAAHQSGPFPFHCEHDELFVMSDPDKYTPQELAYLDKLGFFVNDDGGFSSFRYGSA